MKLRILYHYLKTLRLQKLDRAELTQYQSKKMQAWENKTLALSPYLSAHTHREFFQKSDMMDHFDEWNTVGISGDQAMAQALEAETSRDFSPEIQGYTIGLSSGTSGFRGMFLASAAERDLWAGVILAKVLPRPLWQRHRIAFFLRANSNLYETVSSRVIQFQFYDLSQAWDQLLNRLQSQSAQVLIAPAMVLKSIAEAQSQGLIQINPEKIVSVAEVLEPDVKAFIEGVFQQQLHEVYQCTEGLLATTCEKGALHLNEEHLIIEKKFLNASQTLYNPIISDFSRKTQPIYKYQLNDVLEVGYCDCGRASEVIRFIHGRCDDILYKVNSEDGQTQAVFPDIMRHIILSVDLKIDEYQLRQVSAQHFIFASTPLLQGQEAQQLRATLHSALGPHIQIDLESLHLADRMTKHRRILQQWKL